jgi:hypothetical protein
LFNRTIVSHLAGFGRARRYRRGWEVLHGVLSAYWPKSGFGDWNCRSLLAGEDLKGGWTNRYAQEFTQRFPCATTTGILPRWLTHFWITGLLGSSELASERAVREAVLTPCAERPSCSGMVARGRCASVWARREP